MDLKSKYGEDYILLGGLREYIEEGIILASMNWWRDSLQNFSELEVVERRAELLNEDSRFGNSEFLVAFMNEKFENLDFDVPEDAVTSALFLIEQKEGREVAELTKELLILYTVRIAKATKEDYLSFLGISDEISDAEEQFISRIKLLFEKQ